jgi:hypothetical protein
MSLGRQERDSGNHLKTVSGKGSCVLGSTELVRVIKDQGKPQLQPSKVPGAPQATETESAKARQDVEESLEKDVPESFHKMLPSRKPGSF